MKYGYLFILLVGLISCFDGHDSLQEPPVGIGSEEPFLLTTDHGIYLSWMEPIEGDIHLRYSVYSTNRWSEPKTIAKGSNWFVNWADFPALINNDDKLIAHFLEMSGTNTYDYDIMYTISNDRGKHWSEPVKLNSDTIKGEHGFVSGIPYKDGFALTWLDGRYTKGENPRMSLRGALIGADGLVSSAYELDSMTCDCCQTAMVMGAEQPLVFYRDRTVAEVRDISFVTLGEESAVPRRLHDDLWEINACPVNGPAVDRDGQTIGVAWYAGKESNYEVKLKISNDAGKTFGPPIKVDGPQSFGRVDVKLANDIIYITYLTRKDEEGSIVLATYDFDGSLRSKLPLATVSLDRGTGFPRTAIWQNKLLISWTDVEEKRVKLLSVPLSSNSRSASMQRSIN